MQAAGLFEPEPMVVDECRRDAGRFQSRLTRAVRLPMAAVVVAACRAVGGLSKGDWDRARYRHGTRSRDTAWLHAYLHGLGRLCNARYWYAHAPREGMRARGELGEQRCLFLAD